MFNPKRLVLARKRRRLTGKQLANEIGVSPVTVSRLEQANNEPDPETLNSLIKILGFPKQFFFEDDMDELVIDAVSFRSLTSKTAKEKDSALASGALAYLLSDWVSKRFNLPEPDLIDLSQENDPAGAAATLRRHWGLGEKPISNMIKLLESKGVRVFSLSERTKNVDAFSCWRDNTPYVFLNTFKTAERSRFDAAHELGHLVLHRHAGACQGKLAESDANNFASSFLMPDDDIFSKIPFVFSLKEIVTAKKRWGVSVAALAYRLHKMKILTDWQYRTYCIQINKLFGIDEPQPLLREDSVVWSTIFTTLWNERITKDHVAADLHIPLKEIENLIFGLICSPKLQNKFSINNNKKLHLKIV